MSGTINQKFAINAHGFPGELHVNGVNLAPILKADNLLKDHIHVMHFLDYTLEDDASVYLCGCLAGLGPKGTEFVLKLSEVLTPRTIVAFSTIGYTASTSQMREGEKCTEPGARDTEYNTPANRTPDGRDEYNRYFRDGQWNDLNVLPWQSETSPHAKVARAGKIIRGEKL